MYFKKLAQYFSELDKTSLRNSIMEILSRLFKEADATEVDKICYLLQGRVVSSFDSLEFGVADKMMIKAISLGLNVEGDRVVEIFKERGDLGKTADKLKIDFDQKHGNKHENLTVGQVYHVLYQVAVAVGPGSQEEKTRYLGNLIKEADPLSACYIVKLTLGKLRLGFSDMTILDSFSYMLSGSKEHRVLIETAYNVRPDLGFIGKTIKQKGIKALGVIQPEIGIPIRMARADRLTSAAEILDKIGKCAVESKYDGLRLQVHFCKSKKMLLKKTTNENLSLFQEKEQAGYVKLFSRNLEDLTPMFPEIVDSVLTHVKANEAIFEGEIVAYNPKTGVSIPFQQTMQRRRKYDIAKKAAEIPVKLYTYELLYLDGVNLIKEPYIKRKTLLKKIIKENNVLCYAQEEIIDNEKRLDGFFHQSVKEGYEGIIAKRLEGVYQAGVRGWNWIKLKRGMSKKLMDTFDVLVMGYTLGEGKRTDFGVGQFLTGVLDEKKDEFVTLSKIGTGLTDEQFKELKKRVTKLEISDKPKNYNIDKLLEADIWLKPELVVEISADEITRSQVHTAGRVMEPSKSGTAFKVKIPGFALRFPRLVRFRDDKSPQDITTVTEVEKMFKKQGNK